MLVRGTGVSRFVRVMGGWLAGSRVLKLRPCLEIASALKTTVPMGACCSHHPLATALAAV